MTAETAAPEQTTTIRPPPSLGLVIVASSAGSLIEWYDFYLYASMGVYLGRLFFPQDTHQGMLGLLFTMATLGIGFAIRPVGGLIFGSMGDRLGRKFSFISTLVLMGLSTTCMGLLPSFPSIGYAAPFALLLLRILQGLAAGGEVGGAFSYVAENAPDDRRGWYLGILTGMSPLGSLISLAVVYLCRVATGSVDFATWGWRLPFLLSGVLTVVSLRFRLRLQETAAFEALQRNHQEAKSPVRELFTTRENIVRMLLGVFGSTAAQGALGTTALVLTPSFMQAILHVDIEVAASVALVAVMLSLPCYIAAGWICDRVGRRPMIILGSSLALIFYVPIYYGIHLAASPPQFWLLVFYNWVMILFVAIMLPATAASLAELFPTRFRSTGVGISYNISNGLLNGFLPLIGFGLISSTGNIYTALAYPMVLAAITAIVSLIWVRESYRVSLTFPSVLPSEPGRA